MTNQEIARVFKEIADMLGLQGEDWFKIRAYLKVVQSIEQMQEPVEKMASEKRLREIPGVGDAIEKKIEELVTTGKLTLHEKLKAEFPDYKGDKVD
jgi:DNA polymerase (family 10)